MSGGANESTQVPFTCLKKNMPRKTCQEKYARKNAVERGREGEVEREGEKMDRRPGGGRRGMLHTPAHIGA